MRVYIGLIALLVVAIIGFQDSSLARARVDPDKGLTLTDIQELVELADSLREMREFNSAILVAETAIEMMEENPGFDSLYAYTLMKLGGYYSMIGHPLKASQCFARCISLEEIERWLGSDMVAYVIRRLGAQYRILGRYAEAESTVLAAIQFIRDSPGRSSLELVRCLKELGSINQCQLRYAEAEERFKSAMDVCRNSGLERRMRIGQEADVLGRLGNLRFDQGRLSEAESLHIEAFHLAVERWGEKHQNPSEHLNNLARVCMKQGRYAEAESLCSEALRRRASDIGLDHPWTVYQLLNLAEICALRGDYVMAEFYSRLCLRTIDKTGYGKHHPQAALSTRILADCSRVRGRFSEADNYYFQALDAFNEVFGRYHPEVARSLESLGLLYASAGDMERSLSVYDSLLASKQFFIDMLFNHASEGQKMRYISTYPLIDYPLLSLALVDATGGFRTLGLNMVLRGKGVVMDALSKERRAVKLAEDSSIVKTWELWKKVIDEISTLYLSGDYHLEASKELFEGFWIKKDSLEADLSGHPEFRGTLADNAFTLSDIADVIPESGVLWEFIRYSPFDFRKLRDDPNAMGDPRYLAFTLDRAGKLTVTDLDDAQKIDSLIAVVRDHVYRYGHAVQFDTDGHLEQQLTQTTGELYEIIFAPLLSQSVDKDYLLISPDGQLNLLPFEILPCPDGQYAIEKFKISYLSTGRDLLKFKEKSDVIRRAVLIADPDFDLRVSKILKQKKASSGKHPVGPSFPINYRTVSGCLEIPFDRIPSTEEEVHLISRVLKRKTGLDVAVYMNSEAREEALREMSSPPQILHLATHGFFCVKRDEDVLVDHPLLRSGLLFASANCSILDPKRDRSPEDDGILTALEASGLDLIGTELVVLSACETGLGEIKNGEGVYGLRRAFQHAGAKAIVMSLWAVPDQETRELMVGFYENWISRDQSKRDALRQAILRILRNRRASNKSTHPALWGGFVLLGDPN